MGRLLLFKLFGKCKIISKNSFKMHHLTLKKNLVGGLSDNILQ
jgi:hypothetical protein